MGLLLGATTAPFLPIDIGLLHYDARRIFLLGFLVLSLAAFWLAPGFQRTWLASFGALSPMARWLILAFFGLGLVSALTARHPLPALTCWAQWLGLFWAAIALAGALGNAPRWLRPLPLVLLTAGITVYLGDFLAAHIWATFSRGTTLVWNAPFHNYANVRFLNQVQTWTLPLLALPIYWAWVRGGRGLAGLLALMAGSWWALLFATGSRGSLLALAIATLLSVFVFRCRARPWLVLHATLAGLGVAIYFALFALPSGAPGLDRAVEKSGQSDQRRLEQWQTSWELAGEHPVLGVGPMHLALPKLPRGFAHPHNSWLQLAAEWGFPATAAATVVGLWGWGAWSRRERQLAPTFGGPEDDLTRSGVYTALVAGAGHSLVSGVLVMPASLAVGLLVTAWGLALYRGLPGGGSTSSHPPLNRGFLIPLAGSGLIALIVLAWIMASHSHRLAEIERAHSQAGHAFHPRFWLQGQISRPPWQPLEETPGRPDQGSK